MLNDKFADNMDYLKAKEKYENYETVEDELTADIIEDKLYELGKYHEKQIDKLMRQNELEYFNTEKELYQELKNQQAKAKKLTPQQVEKQLLDKFMF